MQIQTKGIILKQTKTINDRKILVMFSQEYGKISVAAGNTYSQKKNKTSLAYRPFTLGRYDLFKGRELYNINRAETIHSYFKIGEDVEKYMHASYILEFVSVFLIENEPMPKLFQLLTDFFEIMEERSKEYLFLVRAFQLQLLDIAGYAPVLHHCVVCGKEDEVYVFDPKEGGLVCQACRKNSGLIYSIDSAIIDKIKYMISTPLKRMGKLYLDEQSLEKISELLKTYFSYHLDIQELKSESFLTI